MKISLKKPSIIIAIITTIILILALVFIPKTSMFSSFTEKLNLKEGTEEEVSLDNWEISTVFYDSTVDEGKTPLTEINWDASDGGYGTGETRIITVQINYKNTNAVTTYQPGELEIGIPNLIYKNSTNQNSAYNASLGASVLVGANDNSHTGYDWNFVGETPDTSQEYYYFTNKNTIEKKSNFEGSIQIQYTITPQTKTVTYLNESIINYLKKLKASIGESGNRIYESQHIENVETTITSPNWPNNYSNNMTESENFWEYSNPEAKQLIVYFAPESKIENRYDKIYIYNKSGDKLYTLTGSEMAGTLYIVNDNYVKISMTSDSSTNYNGFSASIGSNLVTETFIPTNLVFSNEISFNYTRKYIHPWSLEEYSIEKRATKISSLDGLIEGDYYWVKYNFEMKGYLSPSYPKIGASYYIEDIFPENCVVLDRTLTQLSLENGYYRSSSMKDTSNYLREDYLFVGYPKSVYNEESNNLIITNNVNLYIKYNNQEEYVLLDNADITINLAEFDFEYTGDLYSIQKYTRVKQSEDTDQGYEQFALYYQSLTGIDTKLGGYGRFSSLLRISTIYTGQKMNIKFGDDALYITDSNNNYKKLIDNEYYFSYITFPSGLKNGNDVTIPNEKYECELWVRYANNSDYSLYETFKNKDKTWTFTEENAIVEYYFIIKDVTESIVNYTHENYVNIVKAKDIAESGTIYNLGFLQVFSEGVLLNEAELNSYNNIITKEMIAQSDLNKYGQYIQRSQDIMHYNYWNIPNPRYNITPSKEMTSFVQNAEEEKFTGTATIKLDGSFSYSTLSEHVIKNYHNFIDEDKKLVGFVLYDLLPQGMELTSTKEEIINSLTIGSRANFYIEGNYISTSNIIKNNLSLEIIENWKNTGRTMLMVDIDFKDTPALALIKNIGGTALTLNIFRFQYNYAVSYDAFLENGSTWKNTIYFNYKNRDIDTTTFLTNKKEKDNGTIDSGITDINNNNQTNDYISYSQTSKSINSLISTHQDITTYVKTDQSNYSTGNVDTSCNSEYEYKLRVRSGSNKITKLTIYSNLEESHNSRTHWKGEFLGIDTTYAEAKGYTIKTYYSEKTNATNMNDDTSWKEYTDTTDKSKVKSLAFVYLDETGKPAILPENSLTYVLIKMKSPADESIKSVAYNSSWTEWTALDDSGEEVDFITGINSNTVKLKLPNSIEPVDIEINLEKIWDDNNNQLGLRPNEITYQIIPNNDSTKAIDFILNINDTSLTDPNKWTKNIEVPKFDDNGDEIEYTINEVIPTLENNYTYIKTINNYSITNQLAKNIIITKKWIDNSNSYLTRPSNVVIKVLQNNKEYKTVTITGDYTTNEWSNNIAVPVYDSEGNEYTYTLEELEVDDYSTTYDSTNLTFTNKLTGEEKITITKEWLDNSNAYNTRPLSIDINLNQNNKLYKKITLSGTTNIWKSNEITVPKYDDNGIKYNYTIEEINTLNEYGLIDYDQNNYKITNKLKNTTNITITKTWIDGDNAYNTRPKDLTITLLQNDVEYQKIVLNGTTNIWTTSIEVPKYDNNQKEYKYTIKEIDEGTLSDYQDITYSEDGLSVTNKLKKDSNLIITKKWIDKENEYKTRPTSVKINLYQNNILYKELELSGDTDTWTTIVEKAPVYDENGQKYSYVIEEIDILSKYQKITYDQTTLTVTNELTEKPKVTLYFTVKNGYTTHDTEEVKFDSEGLNEILKNHNINPDDEYLYEFELENTETKKVYKGNLSTQGILEFPDLPYGTYRALQKDDEYFDFVKMINLEDVPGVKFTEDARGGIIEIEPTGKDIIYGVNIVNKITMPVKNVDTDTGSNINIMLIIGLISALIIRYLLLTKKKLL